jgi:hypothetical protein
VARGRSPGRPDPRRPAPTPPARTPSSSPPSPPLPPAAQLSTTTLRGDEAKSQMGLYQQWWGHGNGRVPASGALRRRIGDDL